MSAHSSPWQKPGFEPDTAMAERARERNLNPVPLSSYYHMSPGRRGLVMGYAAVDEAEIGSAFNALKSIMPL